MKISNLSRVFCKIHIQNTNTFNQFSRKPKCKRDKCTSNLPGALDHGPFEAVLESSLVLPVADEYWPLSCVSVAPTGLSDAAWLPTELKTETETTHEEKRHLVPYGNKQYSTS